MRPLLVGIGEILWDMLPGGKQLGGAPANFAYQANALGGRGVVVSRVGEDELGREILARLDSCGVDRAFVSTDGRHPTGTVEVRVDERGVPEYVIHQVVAWDHVEVTPELMALAPQVDCVCYGTLAQRGETSRKSIAAFLRATRPQCLRVFDINLRQNFFNAGLIEELLGVSRVMKLNDAELPVVGRLLGLGEGEGEIVNGLFGRFGLKAVALTRGAKGSSIFTPVGRFDQPAARVKVADTVGAGDAFTAAMALGMCAGVEMGKIGEMAAGAAAFVCTQAGAMPAGGFPGVVSGLTRFVICKCHLFEPMFLRDRGLSRPAGLADHGRADCYEILMGAEVVTHGTGANWRTIAEMVSSSDARGPDAPALLAVGRESMSYAVLWGQTQGLARQLRGIGIGAGDRVAIVLPNGPEMAAAFLAVAGCAVAAPLNPGYRTPEFEFYLSDLNAKALLIARGMESDARNVARGRGIPIVEVATTGTGAGEIRLENVNCDCDAKIDWPGPDDVALILHTSGTTSRPKIVPLTQSNLCASARNISGWLALTPADRCMNVMPLFHIHGLVAALLSTLASGGSVACTEGFVATAFWERFREFNPTWYTAVPTMHQAIVARPEAAGHDPKKGRIRFVRSSSAALPPQVAEQLERVFDAPVLEAYDDPVLGEPLPAAEESADILDLTDDMRAPEASLAAFRTIDAHPDVMFTDAAAATPPPMPEAPPAKMMADHLESARQALAEQMDRPLLSTSASAAVDNAFNSLAHTVLSQNARTLDDLVKDMLRPMLKSWLDDNLPSLVERLVRAEIERVSRGR